MLRFGCTGVRLHVDIMLPKGGTQFFNLDFRDAEVGRRRDMKLGRGSMETADWLWGAAQSEGGESVEA